MITARDFLRVGSEILDQRGRDYDTEGGERSVGRTVEAFNAMTGHQLTAADGWLFLLVLKVARQRSAPGFHLDSAQDLVGYAGLLAEAWSIEGDLDG